MRACVCSWHFGVRTTAQGSIGIVDMEGRCLHAESQGDQSSVIEPQQQPNYKMKIEKRQMSTMITAAAEVVLLATFTTVRECGTADTNDCRNNGLCEEQEP
jgi:hypothetical protein